MNDIEHYQILTIQDIDEVMSNEAVMMDEARESIVVLSPYRNLRRVGVSMTYLEQGKKEFGFASVDIDEFFTAVDKMKKEMGR